MKTFCIVAALLFIIFVSACSSTSTPEIIDCPVLPTPDVPPLADMDEAINRWENNDITRYFVETEERRQDRTWKVRLVVVDDQIRAAQRLEKDAQGNWSAPVALSIQEAEAYTVDGVLARLRQDVLADGPAPVNVRVDFDSSLGYPRATHAEAISFCDEDGRVVLGRQYSYDLGMNVEGLLEDIFGVDREPIFTLVRSGGPEAWCDSLRIYPDESSIYADECSQEIFNLSISAQKMAELELLGESFGSLDDLHEQEAGFQRLIITGSGEGTPSTPVLETAWDLAAGAVESLSIPVGLGMTVVYIQEGELQGFDVFNQTLQPADLNTRGELYGAALSTDGLLLAYGDESGLRMLVPIDRRTSNLLLPPEQGYYVPLAWAGADRLLVANVLNASENVYQLGWVSVEEATSADWETSGDGEPPVGEDIWQELPLPPGVDSYGCDTGAAWSPHSDQLAITGLEYGPPCNVNGGLTIVDIDIGSAERLLEQPIATGEAAGSTVTAGAHTPAWSPDGEWIAVGLDQDSDGVFDFPARLHIMRPDGSDLIPLTDNSQGQAAYAVWSPDGILYYALSGAGAGRDGIYQFNPAAQTNSLVIKGSDLRPVSVSPDGQFLLYEQDNGLVLWGFLREETIHVTAGAPGNPATFSGWLDLSE